MSNGGWLQYSTIFLASAFLSLVFTPLALKVAVRRSVLDHPGDHKSHESPVPYLGGLAMVGAFSLAVLAAAVIRPPVTGRNELFVVVALAFGLSLVGLFDDIRHVRPWARVLCEIGAGYALYEVGAGVELFGSDLANALFTIVWVVAITNAFNLLDNMDGLSAGVAAIGAGAFFAIAAANGQFLVAGLAAAVAGCAIGFLRHNFHPARIYMGDSGSLFLGFLLAYLGVKLRFDGPTSVTFLVPILVVGIAIFDTTLVTICRLLRRRSPFQGGRDHVSHRLVAIGVPVPVAVSLIYVAAVSVGVVGFVVSRIERAPAYWLAGLFGTLALFLGVLLARVPVYEVEAARSRWRRRLAASTGDVEVPDADADTG
jgi:UDP-GlcNAc:undecaprenyl-phosphate/decaprenyl-phosphate GlcNAc-1-phosphate transferase